MAEKRLANQRSPRWAFMERFEVPNYDGDGNYLTRWRLVQTPLGAVYLHRFDGPDPRPTLHDHPWNFVSIVLRGGYVERRQNPLTLDVNEEHRVRLLNVVRAEHRHSITRLLRQPTWTLLLVGRRRRTWGYSEPTSMVWTDKGSHAAAWRWTEFDKHPHAREFDAALARPRQSVPLSDPPSGREGQ